MSSQPIDLRDEFLRMTATPKPAPTAPQPDAAGEFTAPIPNSNDEPPASLSKPTFFERATAMLKRGIPVIPLLPNLKEPCTEHAAFDGTTDPTVVAAWAEKYSPESNCGAVARFTGSWMLDDDLGTLAQTYKKDTGLDLPQTFTVKTSRGFHYYFLHDEASRLIRYGGHENSGVIQVPEVFKGEARCHNQYVVAPGSVHPSGAVYTIVNDAPIVAAPSQLLEWLRQAYTLSESLKPKKGKSKDAGNAKADPGFKKLFEAVGYRPLLKRKHRLRQCGLRPGKTAPCPMPHHEHKDYSNCFGPLEDAPDILHCLGNCGWSGDMVAAVYELDGGTKTYKNMYECARAICKEERLNFDDYFAPFDIPLTPPHPAESGEEFENNQNSHSESGGSPPDAAPALDGSHRKSKLIRGDQIQVRKVPWLWKGRLIANGLTGFSGEGGHGKSTIAADIVARITCGRDFPDGALNLLGPKDVLIICDEDGREDTIKPRLMAAGADMTHVWFLDITVHHGLSFEEASVRLDQDMPLIEKECREHPDIVLIIPDPVTEYLGNANPNSNQDVAPIYSKMLQLSKQMSVAWLLISHFNKDREANAVNRNSGAKVMTTKPRCNWLFVQDPKSTDDRFLMLQGKCNLAKRKALAFYIDVKNIETTDENGNPITLEEITYTRWDGETDDKADDVLLRAMNPKDSAVLKVREFLDDFLAEGPKPARECYNVGKTHGIFEDAFKTHARCAKLQIYDAAKGRNEWWWGQTSQELHDLRARMSGDRPAPEVPSESTIVTFLDGLIGEGCVPVKTIKAAAEARGLNWESVVAARKRHGYQSITTDKGKCWQKAIKSTPTGGESDAEF